jgi:hypothetical protein
MVISKMSTQVAARDAPYNAIIPYHSLQRCLSRLP